MLYIGTSTQFQFHIVSRDALEQLTGSNRVDTILANGTTMVLQKGKQDETFPHQEH